MNFAMTKGNYLTERWQGLSRRSRISLVLIGGCITVLTLIHANTDAYDKYVLLRGSLESVGTPDYNYYGEAYGVQPIAVDDTSAVWCDWAEVDLNATRKIREKAAPSFPLLSAWLKPEAGEFSK
jgi:hypothetical protein